MSKSSRKPSFKGKARRASAKQSQSLQSAKKTANPAAASKPGAGTSKQDKVIAMLSAASGTTIAAIMRQTGWQQHSVRGFLAGVVRKRLKLQLKSDKVDGQRFYRLAGSSAASGSRSGGASA
jgi:hypothetical protein